MRRKCSCFKRCSLQASLSRVTLTLLLALVGSSGCTNEDEVSPQASPHALADWRTVTHPQNVFSQDAKEETHVMLQEDMAREHHPADGAGRAWLEAPLADEVLFVGSPVRFVIGFEAGPLGVAKGGAVFLQVSPFWGWDTPQASEEFSPGYTVVSSEVEGLVLDPYLVGSQLLAIPMEERALLPGEKIRIEYGAGPMGARVDEFAGREATLWIAVDGDGDGTREILKDSPSVDIRARTPGHLQLTWPSSAAPGDVVRLSIAILDDLGNAGIDVKMDLQIENPPAGWVLPGVVQLKAEDRGVTSLNVKVGAEGIYTLRLRGQGDFQELMGESNPLLVGEQLPRLCWADLHGHSGLSDGTGTPEDYYRYARDVSALDVSALTDHDHWGMRFLDSSPELWERIEKANRSFHEPGRFVTLLAYEWTSWLYGHRHVLYFSDEGEVLSSLEPRYESPDLLWDALRGKPAMTFAHHSAGGPISTSWSYAPDPELEPVTEIVSVHGSSEALDSPSLIYNPLPGNFVRDVIDHGYRLGFIGSGDSHDGHPGLTHIASPEDTGGLAGIFCEELSRPGVLAALRKRATFATNGPRIWLRMEIDGVFMGGLLPADLIQTGPQELVYDVVGTGLVKSIELVRSGAVVMKIDGEGRQSLAGKVEIPRLKPGEYLYLRVVQENGGAAWSSPVFAE